jgi:aspartate aminotransferase
MTASQKILESIEKSSWIRRIFEEGNERKAKYGAENVFDFSLGNPNLEPPVKFKEILKGLVNDPAPGRHGYMSNAGYIETRTAVADYLKTFNNQDFSPQEIVMTVGASGGLNIVFKTILDAGQEVVIPSPYFVEYNNIIDTHRGVPKVVPTKPDFSLDLEAIEGAFTENTKAVLINSPNNPTGRMYVEEELEELGKLLKRVSEKRGNPIYLVSDEPYRKIVYDGLKVPSIFNAYKESIVITSFSKDLSLVGERIGYASVNPDMTYADDILQGMVICNRVLGYVNAPAFMQRAISHLLEDSVDISIYQKKRDMLCDALGSFGYDFIKPEGTFYLFPKSLEEDDVAFVNVLKEENILTVPGSGFWGPGYFRIAYCVPDDVIERSLPGFERVIKKYR